jgi:TolA-binding protein
MALPYWCGAQKTTVYSDALAAYKRGLSFFDNGAFGQAMQEYRQAVDLLGPANEPTWQSVRTKAALGYATAAIRIGLPDGEKLMVDFIRQHQPDPIAGQALIEVANYFHNAREYDKAIDFFSQVNTDHLSYALRSEVLFKLGYSYFVRKQFQEAEYNFIQVKDMEGAYYYAANYYYGLCRFFSDAYSEAITAFRRVEHARDYQPHVPYYITQIYFAQRDFDQLIRYAVPKLADTSIKNLREMNQLVGQAYFEKADFASALPYLEKYGENTARMREEEFYQLAFCQYKMNKYDAAARNFHELTQVQSPLGQMALYYLGDSQLRLKDKQSARNAFAAASRMSFDPAIQETSLLHFAKLSYELRFEKEALAALQSFGPSSSYYGEAQSLMGQLFLSIRDYGQAVGTLEAIPNKTAKLKEAYQQVLYRQGMQYAKDGKLNEAASALSKSLETAVNQEIKALSLFWLGDVLHQRQDYNRSIDYLNQFLTLSKSVRNLPEESSPFTANYLQGYNYLKKGNYTTAQSYFQDAVAGIKRNRRTIRNKEVKDGILGDATLRAGDCMFKKNQYRDAIRYYDEAIQAAYPGFEYALYQKAIIEGLRGNTTEKILALEDLVAKFPASDYADDAYYQMGTVYQEMNQMVRASDAFRGLVEKYPHTPLFNAALLRLGLIAYNQGNTQYAINFYKQVFSHSPEKPEADAALAALREIYLKDLGDPEGFNSFLETVPGFKIDNAQKDENAFAAAEAAYESGNYDRAISAYSDYLAKYPNGIHVQAARYHRAESFLVQRQYSQALKDLDWLVDKEQGRYYVDAVGKAARILYHNEQDFERAFQYFSRWEAIVTDPDDKLEAQVGLLYAAYRLDKPDAVAAAAQKVLNNPGATNAQLGTAHFFSGKLSFDKKDYRNAATSFEQTISLIDNEQSAEARYLIAQILYQRRELEKAKEQCMQNNTANADYPFWAGKSILLLSDIYAEQNDLFSARTVLELLIENYSVQDDDILPAARQKLESLKRLEAGESRLERENDFMDDGSGN